MDSIFTQIAEALSFTFIQRALLAGIMIGAASSLLGIFIVLRKMSLIGDGLAHISFAAVALGILMGKAPLLVSLPIVVLASLVIFKLSESKKVDGDAAIGIVSGIGIAGGVLIASAAGGFNIDLFSYLFGSILAISNYELILSVVMAVLIITTIILFYHDLFTATYDPDFAFISGIKTRRINLLLTILSSVTIVLGIGVAGTMLISSLLIFPAVSSLQVFSNFKQVIISAVVISCFSVVSGVFISYVVNLPAGATIVMVNAVVFFGALGVGRVRKG